MSLLLHYDCLGKFEEIYFEGLLTQLHIVDHDKHVVTVKEKGNSSEPIDVPINEYCTILEKGNKKYIMPSKYVKELPIKIKGVPNKYSLKTDVFQFLEKSNVATAKFKPEKTMSFKELIDRLTNFKHSNQQHYKLFVMMAFAQMLDRANFRIATPAGFGKDSIVDIMGHLFGEAHTIENPTIAKLEKMTYAKLLAVNEVVDISNQEWRNIEQFLLATGAFKNKVTKRSRAYGGVSEILDTSKLSLTLMYNDITHYPTNVKYFDTITKDAVKDRFPAIRLYGTLTEDFNKIATVSTDEYVKKNLQEYIKIIRAFYYYKDNLLNELHYYKSPPMSDLPERWKINIGRVLKIVDAYSNDQEEFSSWADTLIQAMKDYKEMVDYPHSLLVLAEKLRITKDEFKKEPTLGYIRNFLRNRYRVTNDSKYNDYLKYCDNIMRAPTFEMKNSLIKYFQIDKNNKGIDKW